MITFAHRAGEVLLLYTKPLTLLSLASEMGGFRFYIILQISECYPNFQLR